jgi:hypothetical protein
MLQELFNRLNEEELNPKFNEDEDEISVVVGMSNSEDMDEDEKAESIFDASEVEAIVDEMVENGEELTYFYDSYDRPDGVNVETINITAKLTLYPIKRALK